MDVILLKDHSGKKKGEVIKVNDGFAYNYLFPNKVAVIANDANLKKLKAEKEKEKELKEKDLAESKELKSKINNLKITMAVQSGESKIFGSVTNKEIAGELQKLGYNIDKKDIIAEGTLKTLGEYTIAIKLHSEVTAKIILNIISDKKK